ncbi:hypothetical protein HCU01_02520 [Halomonas cupida]|uniref:Lysophospholipase L1 n=1 Tax=Halomonas cupida TaxID=44933 RepID=A0A1M7APS3_9GAMM|nr:SGNH/GDSL hydrolase family protein [Halomonas cupida]GEN22303.1 hypothetical protein HCU01_02520 [Halomonas cupida]SHL44762.1 Lysophospholipase L1 [Halomonas cupida]
MKSIRQFSQVFAMALVLVPGLFSPMSQASGERSNWVATWSASPQPVWGDELLFPTRVPEQLEQQTVRQVARLSLGGKRLRIELSNAYGSRPVTIGKVSVALAGMQDAIDAETLRQVMFDGSPTVTIPAGASMTSDPVALAVEPLGRVTVSTYLPEETPLTTFHWDGRQTSWFVEGDQADAPQLVRGDDVAESTTARVLLTGIDVAVDTDADARAVAVIGDSITDGAGASLDGDTRWPDFLAERLAPHGVAVINAGISGGRLLSDGMGTRVVDRLRRDVLDKPGVQDVIVLVGINDIAWPGTALSPNGVSPSLEAMTEGYRQLVDQAHVRGIRVIGATLTPFSGALPGTVLDNYYDAKKDALRQQVNEWIRCSGVFDVVIDLDAALRDESAPSHLDERFDSGDRLHPGDEGNRAMAETVDLDNLLSVQGEGNATPLPASCAGS